MNGKPVINRLHRLQIDLFDVIYWGHRAGRPLSPDELTAARSQYARVLNLIGQHAALAKDTADLESEL